MDRLVTVVRIDSFSYSGTTWINLLLGCHPRAMALGPPDRVVDMLYEDDADPGQACRVHGSGCEFWPAFFETYDRAGNFYVQLAEASGRDVVVVNNLLGQQRAAAHLEHPDIDVKQVCVVRDGRAILSSYGRYHPRADYYDTVVDWFCPFAALLRYDPQDPDLLSVRYEDVVADQGAFIDRAGAFLGLRYPGNFDRYWEFDHHLIRCNPGPLAVLKRHLGQPFSGPEAEAQEARYQRLLEDPRTLELDRRWERELGRRDRLVFDYYAGHFNEAWGYERDRFTVAEVQAFEDELERAGAARYRHDAGSPPAPAPARIGARVRLERLRRALAPAVLAREGLRLEPMDAGYLGITLAVLFVAAMVLSAWVF